MEDNTYIFAASSVILLCICIIAIIGILIWYFYTSNNVQPVPKNSFRIRHIGGKCITPINNNVNPINGTPIVYTTNCNPTNQASIFRSTPNGSIQQVTSNKCINVVDNQTRLVMTDDCNTVNNRFNLTSNNTLRHQLSNKCVQPSSGGINPGENVPLVLVENCNGDQTKHSYDPI